MKTTSSAQEMSIYVGDEDRWNTGLLYPAIVEALKESGIAGVTVLRGVEGYGANGTLHTARFELFFQGLPVIIKAIDHKEHIDKALQVLEPMVTEGLITVHDVTATTYSKKTAVNKP